MGVEFVLGSAPACAEALCHLAVFNHVIPATSRFKLSVMNRLSILARGSSMFGLVHFNECNRITMDSNWAEERPHTFLAPSHKAIETGRLWKKFPARVSGG